MGTQTSGGDAGWLVLTVSLRGAVRPAVQVLEKLQTGTNARTRMRYCSRGEEGCLSVAHWSRGRTGQDMLLSSPQTVWSPLEEPNREQQEKQMFGLESLGSASQNSIQKS